MDTLLSVATMYGGEHPLLLDRRAVRGAGT